MEGCQRTQLILARARRGVRPGRGFTLFEILIVIAILLAIGGLVVVNLWPAKSQADIDLQRIQFDAVDSAMERFKLNMMRYPTEEEGLAALWSKDAIQNDDERANWRGPYLKDPITKDKWNHDLVYHFPGQLRGEQYYDLISLGPDGQEGTQDDITNHDRHKNAEGEIVKDSDSFAPPSGGG
jgi:general secretion pathway protein G